MKTAMFMRNLALGLVLALASCGDVAWACPTCKDNMAHDPASANLVRGYAYSILFMLSMPPLIFCGLAAYFYWEVRKAKAIQRAHAESELKAGEALDFSS